MSEVTLTDVSEDVLAKEVHEAAQPLHGAAGDYDAYLGLSATPVSS